MKEGEVRILGCGASSGVPLIGCDCSVCHSSHPKNKRLRSSILIEILGKIIVIDPGPDFRQQALQHRIDRLDGIILTHMHFDHIAGIDDTRPYFLKNHQPIPFLMSQESADSFLRRYDYFFFNGPSLTAKVDLQIVEKFPVELEFLGLNWKLFSYHQGETLVMGIKIGNFAYITDIKQFSETIFDFFSPVDTLVVSALKEHETPFHLSFDQAALFSKKIGARSTFLTHLSHDVDYFHLQNPLPSDVQLAFDGLTFKIKL